jgi:hypothetical protein
MNEADVLHLSIGIRYLPESRCRIITAGNALKTHERCYEHEPQRLKP